MARSKSRFRSAGLQALHDRYIGEDPERAASFEAAVTNAEVARELYRLRTGAGLTQQALAKLVGTTASVICRLEDADYEGHSLSMLQRIAAALDRRVEIRFTPIVSANSRKSRPARLKETSSGKPRGRPGKTPA